MAPGHADPAPLTPAAALLLEVAAACESYHPAGAEWLREVTRGAGASWLSPEQIVRNALAIYVPTPGGLDGWGKLPVELRSALAPAATKTLAEPAATGMGQNAARGDEHPARHQPLPLFGARSVGEGAADGSPAPTPQPAPVAPPSQTRTKETETMTQQAPAATSLARREQTALAPAQWGAEHERIVREAFAPGASPEEFAVMWAGARSRGLDPVKKQIFFIKRFDALRNADVWASQVSIDGFRSIAVSSAHYDGQDEPEYEYDASGALALARVRIWRKGVSRPFVGVARWNEYVQTKGKGNDARPTHMWTKMEHTMLSKCAEALGLRKAFPELLSGLYSDDEMTQAENTDPPAQWRQEPKAIPAAVLTAKDLLDRIKRAETADQIGALIKQAPEWPKVRAHGWLRMIGMTADEADLDLTRALYEADALPPDVLAKLEAAAASRFAPDAPAAASAA